MKTEKVETASTQKAVKSRSEKTTRTPRKGNLRDDLEQALLKLSEHYPINVTAVISRMMKVGKTADGKKINVIGQPKVADCIITFANTSSEDWRAYFLNFDGLTDSEIIDRCNAVRILTVFGGISSWISEFKFFVAPLMNENVQRLRLQNKPDECQEFETKLDFLRWLEKAPSMDSGREYFMHKFIYYMKGHKIKIYES